MKKMLQTDGTILSPRSNREGITKLLLENKNELDEIILRFLPEENKSSKEITNLYAMMRDYPSRRGKGLRGTACLLWCELFGGNRRSALNTAAALELFQDWILIHDDIEDKSDLRRGSPTLHRKFGVPLAINAGDALHGKMWELLLENKKILPEKETMLILEEFSRMLNETTEGQHIELSWIDQGNWNISEEDYLLMVTKKAAWYTCTTPCRLGMILSGDSKVRDDRSLMKKVITFGTNLGISFQVTDDVLNLTAEENKYGKEVLGDIYEAKRTLSLIHLLNHSDKSEKSWIVNCLSKRREERSQQAVRKILNLMEELGSIDYARSVAREYSEKAISSFEQIGEETGAKYSPVYPLARGLIEYLTNRDY
jgi:geranylgeranyl diphosphate synthase type II